MVTWMLQAGTLILEIGVVIAIFAVPYLLIRATVRGGVNQARKDAQPPPAPRPVQDVRRGLANDPIPANWSADLDAEVEKGMRGGKQ